MYTPAYETKMYQSIIKSADENSSNFSGHPFRVHHSQNRINTNSTVNFQNLEKTNDEKKKQHHTKEKMYTDNREHK